MPFTIATVSDCHIGATWGRDPAATLGAVIDAVRATLAPAGGRPDAVLITGDIAHTPTAEEYQRARALLERLGAPLFVVPGNHDDRELLRREFALPESGRDDVSYTAELGPVRLAAVDTKQPGTDRGRLDPERLEWLAGTLAADPVTPTLLAMHHPPLATGVPALDAIGIPADERAALAELLSSHPQIQQIVAGHVHRTIVGSIGGRPVLAIPSTNTQLALDLEAPTVQLVAEPPCFALHFLLDGRLVTHVAPV